MLAVRQKYPAGFLITLISSKKEGIGVMSIRHIAAVDLGASSGRVMLAVYDSRRQSLSLTEIHRFTNHLRQVDEHHHWDLDHLERQIVTGLNKLDGQGVALDGIGIDTWGVDYVLLDKDGNRVGPAYSYRDRRTEGVMETVCRDLGREAIYHRTGIQFLPFNTLYQLKAMVDANPVWLGQVTDLLMIPDYLVYRLTGKLNREYTNATTSQLVNIDTDDWDPALLDYLNVPREWFGAIRHPGHEVGAWESETGRKVPVISVASHDTASAVIGAPLDNSDSAYLCSGTWSLMGIDTTAACRSATALSYNITNEGGIDGHYRALKNIMGLWLFQRLCREHQIDDIAALVDLAAQQSAFASLINPNDDRFLNPPSMTDEIQRACRENGQAVPESAAQLARCVFDSLALLYRQVADELAQLQGRPLHRLHVVGGGCQNDFLNQLCADVCRIEVIAGPIESSTLGNVGCQLMALNEVTNVEQFRRLITQNFPVRRFTPQPLSGFEQAWRTFRALH
jgi:rhamnulokinase